MSKYPPLVIWLVAALWLATGCSGIQHRSPEISDVDKRAALAEIETYPDTATTNSLGESEAARRLYDVYSQIKPAAVEVCRHTGESRACVWDVKYSHLPEYNAFATSGNTVVVFHGIIEATDNEGELAYVLAHELGHHIADHINEGRQRANTGMLITGLGVAAATGGSSGCATYACLSALQNAAQASMQVGGSIGVLMFSVDQEKEADYLAAYIISRAGYDLASSRSMLLKFGARSDQTETGFLDSHPAGPERLASFDKTIQVIQGDQDGMPGLDPPEAKTRPVKSVAPTESGDLMENESEQKKFNPKDCRIYLPDENICIY